VRRIGSFLQAGAVNHTRRTGSILPRRLAGSRGVVAASPRP
jgi:hypothetical protein